MEDENREILIRDDETFLRMTFAERMQHILLVAAFTLLIITGFPLMFDKVKLFHGIIASPKISILRGVLHRAGAVGLILTIVWHVIHTAVSPHGRRTFKQLLPRLRDLREAVQIFGHNLGLTRWLRRRGVLKKFFDRHPFWLFENPPLFGRINFIEKFEYWAVAWGSLIMIVTGFFMWFESMSLRLIPLWLHDIFIVIHDYEAILAFLSILIWHLYNVHLNPDVFPMSKVWLHGQITGRELRLHHPQEYREILEARQQRRRTAQESPSAAGPLPTLPPQD